MTTVIEFLNMHNIKWIALNIIIKNGAKTPVPPIGLSLSDGAVHFKKISDEKIAEFQSTLSECSHIAIDTRSIHQLDIDDPNMPNDIRAYMNDVPYFLSSTKQLPHFFFKTTNMIRKDKYFRNNNNKHEMLTGIWSYCPKDAIMFNGEKEIPTWCVNNIEKPKPHERDYKAFIQANVPHHTKTQVKGITEAGHVITNGRYCENIKREHKSNHVFFAITPTGLCMKCTDEDCSGFIGEEYPFEKNNDEDEPKSDYDIIKDEFELTHFKIMNPVCFVRISNTRGMQIMNKQELKTAYEHMKPIGKRSFIDTWLSDESIKRYECIDMLPPPRQIPYGVYNTWEGFEAERIECKQIGSANRFVSHVRNLFGKANGQYVLSYLASIVQKPASKTGVCLVCIGSQGIGKSTIFDCVMRRIIGEKYFGFTNNPENDLFSRFGELKNQKIMVCLDDFNVGSIKMNADPFKSFITGERVNYEQKGKQTISLLNCANYIMTTNKYDPVKLDSDDRRYAVLECSSKLVGNKKYFNRLYKYIEDPDNIKAIYDFLCDFDTTKIDLARDRPMSELFTDMKDLSREKEYMFIESILAFEKTPVFTLKHSVVYPKYRSWIVSNGFTDYKPKDAQRFGLFMKKIVGLEIDRNNGNGSLYTFNKATIISDLKRKGFMNEMGNGFAFLEDDTICTDY
jgi:hypothetical protein